MLDHYLHTAWSAAVLLCPGRDPAFLLAPPRPGAEPETIIDRDHALAWYEAEHQVLLAVISRAAAAGFDAHAWQLPWALADYFSRQGLWRDQIATQRTALAAARRLGDLAGQARAHHGLGCAQSMSSAGRTGHAHLATALSLYRQLGDQLGQSSIHLSFAMAFDFQRRPDKALSHARQVLALARATGHAVEEANALSTIGWLYAQLGDYPRALAHCGPGLDASRELGDSNGEAATLDSLGYVHTTWGSTLRPPSATSERCSCFVILAAASTRRSFSATSAMRARLRAMRGPLVTPGGRPSRFSTTCITLTPCGSGERPAISAGSIR
jgi:tetratricopeptide (TPR) repeat protein